MSLRKQYRELEKVMLKRHATTAPNVIKLDKDDFKDGKLSVRGFVHLKEDIDYIPYADVVEIVVAKQYESGLKESIDQMAMHELARSKKDRRKTEIIVGLCVLVGAVCLALWQFAFQNVQFLGQVTLIAGWLFFWTAIDKLFFERPGQRDLRWNLLQLMSATIVVDEK